MLRPISGLKSGLVSETYIEIEGISLQRGNQLQRDTVMDKLLFMLLVGIICTSYSLSSENVTVVEEPGSTNGTNITEVNNGEYM